MHYSWAVAGFTLLAVIGARARRRKLGQRHPPIIQIPTSEIFNNPREAYEKALREHGPVIGVARKGNLEFIVAENLIPTVFTHPGLSFEEAIATSLNLRPFVTPFWSFFREIDEMVQVGINPMLDTILERMCPVFTRSAEKALHEKNIDLFHYVHTSIAEAMMVVIFGEGHASERNIRTVVDVATDIAGLTGMYQNASFLGRHLPTLYATLTWIRVISTSVQRFYRIIGPLVWQRLRARTWIRNHDEKPTTLLEFMAFKHARDDGTVGAGGFMWIMAMLMGVIFASVHQTASVAVWVIFEIATRPEHLSQLRAEAHNHVDPVTHELDPPEISSAVQNATSLDAFIREVMRTKGDTLAVCRRTTADIDVGDCTIPKGHLVFPLATLPHFNPVTHPEPDKFKPERWTGVNARPAVMSSPSYLAFGMGRWACPGRILAVSEIKMIVWSLILKATPRLKDNYYRIVDPLNITSVPPEGELTLEPYLEHKGAA